jgi:hypothetical protein
MKARQLEFKWCKYILLHYGITLDVFDHIKPYLVIKEIKVHKYDVSSYHPYLHFVSILYQNECIRENHEYILKKAKHYDETVATYGLSFIMMRLFMADIGEFLEESEFLDKMMYTWV